MERSSHVRLENDTDGVTTFEPLQNRVKTWPLHRFRCKHRGENPVESGNYPPHHRQGIRLSTDRKTRIDFKKNCGMDLFCKGVPKQKPPIWRACGKAVLKSTTAESDHYGYSQRYFYLITFSGSSITNTIGIAFCWLSRIKSLSVIALFTIAIGKA